MPLPSFTLVLAVLAAACTKPTRVTENGTTDGPIFIAAVGDTVRMHEELRIGQLNGPEEYTFALIGWTLPTPDGGVLLYDTESSGSSDNGRIRKFDVWGRFVRYVGGPGEGPGEYSGFPDGVVLADGHLLIVDQGLSRITRYDTSGVLVASWPGPDAMNQVQATADGGWIVSSNTAYRSGIPPRLIYIRYDSTGKETSRFPAPPAYLNGPYAGSGAIDRTTSYVAILPDGRMVSARSDSLTLVVTGLDGETRVGAEYQPVAYLPEEAAAKRAMLENLTRGSGRNPSMVDVPDYKKAFAYMYTDAGGHILFRMRTLGYKVEPADSLPANRTPWHEPFALEVFDSSLRHLGRLETPRRVSWRGAAFSDDVLWLVEEGDANELYLVKWRPDRALW